MRLLILNYEYPPLGGGAGVCTRYQAEGLAELGHRVTVITTWFEGEEDVSGKGNLEVIRLRSLRRKEFRSNPLEMLSWAVRTYRYIRQQQLFRRIDIVLAHFAIPGGLVALPLKKRFKVPYHIVSHGQDIPWFSPRELWFYHALLYLPIRRICQSADKITVLSGKRLSDLNRLTSAKRHDRNRIIPNGCDTDFFKPDPSAKDPGELRILFVGRLTRQKDPMVFLQAARKLQAPGTSFSIEIIGDGPLRRKMEAFVKKHGLAPTVSFTGWLSKSELLKRYQAAHLLVVTSRHEGMSLALMEALATGMYVISTPVSGSEGLIESGMNGEFIAFGDVDGLVCEVQKFSNAKSLSASQPEPEFLSSLRKRISWTNYVKAYHQLIQE
ncbi:MAG: glycosyltransferase family 4 protein [Bacteroidales bacterium]|nr:glycosyltransferase family 4 protein [Bacteroidales bacterium]